MALPPTIRVKLSSEAAGSISITPVVAQELPVSELVERLLGIAGKDEQRIRELLLRGALVSGATRFRWSGWEADQEALRELLATFPDPDPTRPFVAARCVRAVLRGELRVIEAPREAAESGGLFRRATFWKSLMELAGSGVAYAGYSYRDRADRYRRELNAAESLRLREAGAAVRHAALRDQIRSTALASLELYVTR
ncbi:MAG: hypothetical protein ABSC23_07860 [Bryobacteraceae bacterium]|jgi:hypothetical protein